MLTDSPSCLFLQLVGHRETPPVDVFRVAQLDSLPVTAEQLGKVTRQDPLLSKVRRFTKSGWPQEVKGCLELVSECELPKCQLLKCQLPKCQLPKRVMIGYD